MVFRSLIVVFASCALLAVPATAGATAPWACVDRYDGLMTPEVGVEHTLSALCSLDGDGHDLVLYEWDLDGNGSFETSTGSVPLVSHTWSDRGAHLDATVDVGVKVTDAAGESGTYREPLRLTDQINSWFTHAPQLVNPGDTVDLDAYIRPAYPLAGREWTYAWDLDGEPGFEHSSGLIPDATLVAPDATGRRSVGLRVTDDLGNTSVVRRAIEILPRHPSRDRIVYDAPQNLGDAPVASDTPPLPAEPFGAPAPDLTAVPAETPLRRPRLKAIDADKHGMRLRYVAGPKWSRWRVAVSIPAGRAVSYGLPRRKIVFARGTIVFDGRGVGRTSKMRWTKGAYRVFRKVRSGLLDIRAKRIA